MTHHKKIYTIQALRGIAVLLVIFFHLMTIEKKYGGSKTILPDIFQFGMFGVDLFFVISGFVMVTVTQGKFRKLRNFLTFIYHRFSRIYPTYWFYSILVLFVFWVQPSWVNSTQGNQVDILRSFLLLPSQTLPLVMVGWTLIHEIYFYILFSFILLLTPERLLPLVIIVCGGIICAVNSVFIATDPFIKIIFHPLTMEFLGGCLLAVLYQKSNLRINPSILIILSLIIVIISLVTYYVYYSYTAEIEPLKWWRIVIWGIPAMLITYLLVNAERNGFRPNQSLIKIGDSSYSIYLSHLLTLSAAGRIWHIFSVDGIYDNIIVLPVIAILAVFVGVASYSIVEKPLLQRSRRIA